MSETAMTGSFPERMTMDRQSRGPDRNRAQRGQMIVVAALTMIALIGGVSLVLEGGNAYAHQRVAQNAADAVANAGATMIGMRLGGAPKGDADVLDALDTMADANGLDTFAGWYTDVDGHLLTPAGFTTTNPADAAQVGGGDGDTTIPAGTQGVQVGGSQTFGTTFARAIGISQFTASAVATAVAGAPTGGMFMPIVFPVSLTNCDGSGDTVVIDEPWRLSNPDPTDPTAHPIGQEWLIPLCKSGDGSFMILDLDPDKDCEEEVSNPTKLQFKDFPVLIPVDTGNDCAKKVEQAMSLSELQGTVLLFPICDLDCVTTSGTNAEYHIIRITGFYVDYLSYSNNENNGECARTTSPTYGTSLINIVGGNASASCMAGWFVRYMTSGPVGTGAIQNGEGVAIQLKR
jgi:hypothetical protein